MPDDGGVDELVASAVMDMAAFPDLRLTRMLSATQGGLTISEVRIAGTNTGEIVLSDFGRGATGTTGESFPATGRVVDVKGIIVHKFDGDGLISAERQYWNMLELLAQLGMFAPVPEG